MNGTLGVIGVGHLAGYLVEGLRRSGYGAPILLSPRNPARSAALAATAGCRVAPDNRAVAAEARTLFLTVRPDDAVPVLADLPLTRRHLVISACAGASLTALAAAAGPAEVVRAMPLSCAAVGLSPTTIFPRSDRATALLSALGNVIPMDSEAQFETASVNGAVYGWLFALAGRLVALNCDAGLDPATARQLVLRTLQGAAAMALKEPDKPLDVLLDGLATAGGITAQGLAILQEDAAFAPWTRAYESVRHRLVDSQRKPSD